MSVKNHPGDQGQTTDYLKRTHAKSDRLMTAIGGIDELNAWIGLIRFISQNPEKSYLFSIQHQLMSYMSILSGYPENKSFITVAGLDWLIEKYKKNTPPSTEFFVPGDEEISTFINLTRTVCRRTERNIVALDCNREIIRFFNRLSLFLFYIQIHYLNTKLKTHNSAPEAHPPLAEKLSPQGDQPLFTP